jgi:hypothetical protein
MGIPSSINPLFLGAAAQAEEGGYLIERSLRFNSADSAYLSRTPSVSGNRKTWTWAAWVKRSLLTGTNKLLSVAGDGSLTLEFNTANALAFTSVYAGETSSFTTQAVFRDPSAWYHIMLAVDTTQATAASRVNLYVNGLQVTSFSSKIDPSLNANLIVGEVATPLVPITYFNGTSSGSTGTTLSEVLNVFDANISNFFGFGAGGFNPDLSKIWTFTSGYPVNAGDVLTAEGVAGGGFFWGIELANGQTFNTGPLTVSSNTSISKLTTGGFGFASQYNHIKTISVNGSLIRYSPITDYYTGNLFNGYLSDVQFIDGQALTPSEITFFNPGNGQIVPKEYTESYGTSGYHLTFSNNANVSSLGEDTSGNSNNWTAVNFALAATTSLETYLAGASTGNTSTSISEVRNIFDDNPSTYFGFASGGGGDLTKEWTFTGGYPISSGDIVTVTGVSGQNGYIWRVTLGNNQTIESSTTGTTSVSVTASSNTTISKVFTNAGGTGTQYGRVQSISVNGVLLLLNTTTDSFVDSPTSYGTDTGAGGEVRGNYCVLNPVKGSVVGAGGNTYVNFTLSNGNLDFSGAAGDNAANDGTIAVASGKWYWEVVHTGLDNQNESAGTYIRTNATSPGEGRTNGVAYQKSGNKLINNTSSSYGSSWTTSDVIGVALNLDTNEVTYYKNGVSQGAISFTPVNSTCAHLLKTNGTGAVTGSYNFGQRPFAYTAPSGFKALNTANLPAPVVTKPSTVFDTVLYTGTGSTRTISGLGFSPDFVWLKVRNTTGGHPVFDTIRGATNYLQTHSTGAEGTDTDALTAFTSDGFTLGSGGTIVNANISGNTYVAWTWDAGSSTVTNTQGSITSSVRANATAGFSIVAFTGNGVGGATIGHGLGVAPSMIIQKMRSGSNDWDTYHVALGNTKGLSLNSTSAETTSSSGYWNNTSPTSTVYTVGTGPNQNGSTYVAYCFAPVEGYSAFGSYTGNGSADGPFVYLGFRPAFVLVKMSSSTGNWTILDSKRLGYNVDNNPLFPNTSGAEGTTDLIDITSNGFKVRTTDATFNTNAGTYVYAAFAESPFATNNRAR